MVLGLKITIDTLLLVLFIDDSIIFSKAFMQYCANILEVLNT